MPYVTAGEIIKENRIRQNIAQEQLCEGVCTPSTLSKVENGLQNPSKKVFDALCERLHLPVGVYSVPVSREEYERNLLEYAIIDKVAQGDTNIEELLAAYASIKKDYTQLDEQFYLLSQGIILESKKEYAQAKELFLKGINISLPQFSLQNIESRTLLYRTEITLLLNIARVSYFLGEQETGISLMYHLRKVLGSTNASPELYAKFMPCILYNLADYEENRGNFAKELELAEEGVYISTQKNKLAYLHPLLVQKGYALAKLGRIEEAKTAFTQGFTVSDIMGTSAQDVNAKRVILKEFGLSY